MNALTYVTRLPELTPRARELKLSIDWWMEQYQEARVLSSAVWDNHIKAIDEGADKKTIDALYGQGCTLENIAINAWGRWQQAKAELLAFYN